MSFNKTTMQFGEIKIKKSLFKCFLILFFLISLIFNCSVSPAWAALSFDHESSVVDTIEINNSSFGIGIRKGDINGDGKQDSIICTAEEVVVYFAGNTLDTTADLIILGEVSSGFPSYSYVDFGIGDIDKDGYDDLVVGKMTNSSIPAAYLVFGSNSLVGTVNVSDVASVIFYANDSDKKGLGASSTVGDFNGDGNLDIAIGAPTADANQGKALIYFGNGSKNFDNNEDKTITTSGSQLGMYLFSGDFNNDNYDDLVISRPLWGNSEVFIFNGGANMDSTYDVKFSGEATSDRLGAPLGASADLNHDGCDDVCLPAYRNGTIATDAGRVYCFFGSVSFSGDKSVATADAIFSGTSLGDAFGYSIELSDINNDGHSDLIVGATQGYDGGDGYVNIYLGNGTSSFNTTADVTMIAASLGLSAGNFGRGINTGDLDNDGWVDLLVTNIKGGYGSNGGRVYIFEINHGSPSLTVNPSFTTNDTTPDTGGSVTVSSRNIAGAQWSFSNSLPGSWHDCISSGDGFNSDNESFSCHIQSSDLQEGKHTIYFRSYDENQLYLSSKLYAQREILVDYTSPSSFSLLTPTLNSPYSIINSSYLFQDTYHYNTNPSRPTFSWKASSKDTEENTNERTDEGVGIDRYTFTLRKLTRVEDPTGREEDQIEHYEDVFEIEDIVFYPFKDKPLSEKLSNPYYKVETDTYILEYLNFHDDIDHDFDPVTYTDSYDNNIIYLTTKACSPIDPDTHQPKDCWKPGEDNGQLVSNTSKASNFSNNETKYKWIIKAYDKAGNTKEQSRTIYYQTSNVTSFTEVNGVTEVNEESSSLKDRLEREEEKKTLPSSKNLNLKKIKPGSFIILGLFFLGIPLGIYFLLYFKKRKKV